jgi:hypothetical protein
MATFRCLTSGQTVTFTLQHDIDSMRGHAGYVRVDQDQPETEAKQLIISPPTKKMGRPRKVEHVGH